MFADHADVDEDPENKAWAELVEGFDVEGADGGVEFTSDEELKSIVRLGKDSSIIYARRRSYFPSYHQEQGERQSGRRRRSSK